MTFAAALLHLRAMILRYHRGRLVWGFADWRKDVWAVDLEALEALDRRLQALEKMLLESKREHDHCGDSWYCCGACTHPEHDPWPGEFVSSHDGEAARRSGVCNCGASAWNDKVDAMLKGHAPEATR